MGRIEETPSPDLGYLTFECQDGIAFNRRACDHKQFDIDAFYDYLNQRQSRSTGAWGFKAFAHAFLLAEDLRQSLTVLRIRRCLDTAIDKDNPLCADVHLQATRRAADMGYWYECSRYIDQRYKPPIDVRFDSLVRNPMPWIMQINEAYELGATEKQIKAAYEFVERPSG